MSGPEQDGTERRDLVEYDLASLTLLAMTIRAEWDEGVGWRLPFFKQGEADEVLPLQEWIIRRSNAADELAALRAARDTLSRCYTDADAKCADLTAKCERLEADLDALRENEKTVAENLSTILSKGNASTWEQIYHAANDLIARNVEVLDRCIDLERYKTDAINLTAKCERLSDNLLIRTRELEDRTAELERSKEEIAYNELRWMEHMTLVRNDLEAQRDKVVAALETAANAIEDSNGPHGIVLDIRAVIAEIREGQQDE